MTEHDIVPDHRAQGAGDPLRRVGDYLERVRWPNGPICPHCGSVSENHYALQGSAHRLDFLLFWRNVALQTTLWFVTYIM